MPLMMRSSQLVLCQGGSADTTPFHLQDNTDIQVNTSSQQPNLKDTRLHDNVKRGGWHCSKGGTKEIFFNVSRHGNYHLEKNIKQNS